MKKTLLYVTGILLITIGTTFLFPRELAYIESLYKSEVSSLTSTKGEVKDDAISLLAFGDMMFDRGVRSRMTKEINPFQHFNVFKGSTTIDVITANLEGPIIETDRNNCQQKAYSFQFPESIATLLLQEGFNFLNLANNHSFDCYQVGFSTTQKVLAEHAIKYFGGGNNIHQSYTIQEIKGKKIAFVGIDMTVQAISIQEFYPLVRMLKNQNDIVIVQIHWGEEYNVSFTSNQQQVGHALIDAGSDIIIGHHPHVIEPMEIYKGKPIFYSLGNFIFDQVGENENKGLAVKFTISSLTKVELLPFDILNSQPTLMSKGNTQAFCKNYFTQFSDQAEECKITIQ